ncbi:exocyst complex component SEC15B-like [Vigna radiata var. radiata]|uniref:Exocyst complex component SEC15B-like n=1 Tax=Vigna radiata var. radiata TaxID=3916 RepID=A0A1S3UZB1_VIGRR|nr:exocyst complex component SEC15B-like [Vigna radiata var. radiata]
MQTANHLLLIKDYVSLLGVTLRRYGYPIDVLLDVLSKHKDKYHELLLSDCRKQIAEAIAADKFEQMLMKKEYEYSMNVLSFQIQTTDIIPAFPYVAPFSTTVPDCCRIVRSFIEDSVSFMSYGGQLEFYEVVKKYLNRLSIEVLDEALVKLINTSINGVSQAMQMAANMDVLERGCDFFFRHAAQLLGVPMRMVERSRRQFPLRKARDAVEEKTEVQTPFGVKVEGVTVLIAEKKKISISGEEKNAIGDFLEEHVMETLLFLGAGGHVETSGILNLLPFGVEHISSSL